jgi:hypothetical protein
MQKIDHSIRLKKSANFFSTETVKNRWKLLSQHRPRLYLFETVLHPRHEQLTMGNTHLHM